EVRDRLEVRHQPAREPDQLDVALCFALQASTRLDPVEVAVDIDLQQCRGVVAGSASVRWHSSIEAQRLHVELVDEGIDYPDRVVLFDPPSRRSGNNKLCVRASPSMNRLIGYPLKSRCSDCPPSTFQGVFTQSRPGAVARQARVDFPRAVTRNQYSTRLALR